MRLNPTRTRTIAEMFALNWGKGEVGCDLPRHMGNFCVQASERTQSNENQYDERACNTVLPRVQRLKRVLIERLIACVPNADLCHLVNAAGVEVNVNRSNCCRRNVSIASFGKRATLGLYIQGDQVHDQKSQGI